MKPFFIFILSGTLLLACNNAAETDSPAEDTTMTMEPAEPTVDTLPEDSITTNIDSVIRK